MADTPVALEWALFAAQLGTVALVLILLAFFVAGAAWRMAKDTASSSTWPVGETTERSSTRNVSSPRVGAVLRRSRTTFRPTMRAASSAASAEGSTQKRWRSKG